MKFSDAIDQYIEDMRRDGRLNSPPSIRYYRDGLNAHCDDIGNRDPRTVGREDIKRTLARWNHPNTIRGRRAVLVSFYDWCMEEGVRKDNPARQTRRPRQRPASVYRLNAREVAAMWHAPRTLLERRALRLGLGAGLRSNELRHLQRRHFERPGFIWVSMDIAKGGRERWVPVISDLQPLVAEILETVHGDEYVVCGQRNASPARNTIYTPVPDRPMGATTLWRLVGTVAKRAGITADIYPHLLRHAYADHVARYAGLRVAQAMLGHADVRTTSGYVDVPTLDELARAGAQLSILGPVGGYPPAGGAANPVVETVGIEPTASPAQPVEPDPAAGHSSRSASCALAPVLLALRAAFLPIIREGGAA